MKELREEILKKHIEAAYPMNNPNLLMRLNMESDFKKAIHQAMEEYKDLCHAQGSASGIDGTAVLNNILDDIEYGYDLEMIEEKIRAGSYSWSFGGDYVWNKPPGSKAVPFRPLPPGEKEKDSHAIKTPIFPACPCIVLDEPCKPDCTCKNFLSSAGCAYCATYGSLEQRKMNAERIKELLSPERSQENKEAVECETCGGKNGNHDLECNHL